MTNQILIIDDFLDDPVSERKKALSLSYETFERNGYRYPGINITKDKVSVRKIESFLETKFAKSICMYRTYLEQDDKRQESYIHTDILIGDVTGILSLNEDSKMAGGTAFWKHKKTGLEAPNGYKGGDNEFWKKVHDDGFDEENWERLRLVEMKFNRLLLFWSPLFHSRFPRFNSGQSNETARLIKVFFCKAP